MHIRNESYLFFKTSKAPVGIALIGLLGALAGRVPGLSPAQLLHQVLHTERHTIACLCQMLAGAIPVLHAAQYSKIPLSADASVMTADASVMTADASVMTAEVAMLKWSITLCRLTDSMIFVDHVSAAS